MPRIMQPALEAQPFSPAKTALPQGAGIYPRERLFRLLDERHQSPLIWISGPAGAGKTSLISSYAKVRGLPVLWYQIDDRDSDPANFFYYLSLAARNLDPSNKTALPLLREEYLADLPAYSRRYFSDLYRRVKPPFLLVLDDCHEIADQSSLYQIIQHSLSELPVGAAVAMVSRGSPPASFARLRLNRQMKVIDAETLCLTVDELRDLAVTSGNARVDESWLLALHEKTRGWAAGAVMMLESAKTHPALPAEVDQASLDVIHAYFASEVFAKLDAETQEFLLQTAFFPSMTLNMAAQLTGRLDAAEILSDVGCKHYFTEMHTSTETLYQYHDLFRGFLLSQARVSFSVARMTGIQRRTAQILENTGHIDEAIALYLSLADWNTATTAILKYAAALAVQGRARTLERWIRALPHEVIERTPYLLYWLGNCRLPFSIGEARALYEKSYELFKKQGQPEGEYLSWSGIVDTYRYEWGNFTPLDRHIMELEGLLARYPRFPSLEIEIRVLSSMFGTLIYHRPSHPMFPVWEERLKTLMQECADRNHRLIMSINLLPYYFWTGKFAKAWLIFNAMDKEVDAPDVPPLIQITWRLQKAFYHWLAGSTETCFAAVEEGWNIVTQSGVHVRDYLLLGQGASGALAAGNLPMAEDYIRRMAPVLNATRMLDVGYYHYQAAWLALLKGNLPHALEHAKTATQLATTAGTPFPLAQCLAGLAQILFEHGQNAQALAHLARARRIGHGMSSELIEYHCLARLALYALDRGKRAAGISLLRRVWALHKKMGNVSLPFWPAPGVSRLCAYTLEAGVESDHVKDYIRRRDLEFPDGAPATEHWPWPLKIYSLGRFQVLRNDAPLLFAGKAQRKPLELLKALLAFGGRDVGVDQLAEALWPDADGDVARQAFNTTLHRLRKLLDHDKVLSLQNGRLSLDARHCWVDAWVLGRTLGQLQGQPYDGKNTRELLDKAFRLYQGPFLHQEGCAWVLAPRDRLKSKFLRQLGDLCHRLEEEGDWNQAVDCYNKALEVDPLSEAFYQRLMRCYQQQGRRAEALAVYQRCQKTLGAVLGLPPSMETEAIRRSLVGG
ncbi:MAG: BTAD domain-containing putative transcriptional regulator [Pseudomonadota bacterium]